MELFSSDGNRNGKCPSYCSLQVESNSSLLMLSFYTKWKMTESIMDPKIRKITL